MPDQERHARPLSDKQGPTSALGKPTQDEQLLSPRHREVAPFTETDTWRVLRIMGEFVAGFDTLANLGPAVTIFGSARVRPGNPQYEAATEVARLLGEAGYSIITGGGPGIMEAGNQGAQEAGVASIGLNIELPFEQGTNRFVDVPIDFHYFFVRKTMFVKYAQAFVIFPGGFGTMDELFESLTLIQTGKVQNFPIILFDSGYWGGLLSWLREVMLRGRKIAKEDLELLKVTDSPTEVLEIILQASREQGEHLQQEQEAREATRQAYSGDYAPE
ncbi:MAG TPA: TIGR00730 family Rossman fold protein [Candidatus Binatia bacterium]|nr:TIGR00730 family Rossman fold protein [Candidatus Binatia bacterium]